MTSSATGSDVDSPCRRRHAGGGGEVERERGVGTLLVVNPWRIAFDVLASNTSEDDDSVSDALLVSAPSSQHQQRSNGCLHQQQQKTEKTSWIHHRDDITSDLDASVSIASDDSTSLASLGVILNK